MIFNWNLLPMMIRHLDTFLLIYQNSLWLVPSHEPIRVKKPILVVFHTNQRLNHLYWLQQPFQHLQSVPYFPLGSSLSFLNFQIVLIGQAFNEWKLSKFIPERHACSFERNNRRLLGLYRFVKNIIMIGWWKVRLFSNRSYAPEFWTVTKASWNTMNHFDFRSRCIIKFCQV